MVYQKKKTLEYMIIILFDGPLDRFPCSFFLYKYLEEEQNNILDSLALATI